MTFAHLQFNQIADIQIFQLSTNRSHGFEFLYLDADIFRKMHGEFPPVFLQDHRLPVLEIDCADCSLHHGVHLSQVG